MRPHNTDCTPVGLTSQPVASETPKQDKQTVKLLFFRKWQSTKEAFGAIGNRITGAAASFFGGIAERLSHCLTSFFGKSASARQHIENDPRASASALQHIQTPAMSAATFAPETSGTKKLVLENEEKEGLRAFLASPDSNRPAESGHPFFNLFAESVVTPSATATPPINESDLFASLIEKFGSLSTVDLLDSFPGAPEKNYGNEISADHFRDHQRWLRDMAGRHLTGSKTVPNARMLARAMSADFLKGKSYEEKLQTVIQDLATSKSLRAGPSDTVPLEPPTSS